MSITNIIKIVERHVLFRKIILNGIELPESIKILNNNILIEHDINFVIIPNNIIEIGDVHHLQIL